jgi:transglutaminase-like putative cysteine protease
MEADVRKATAAPPPVPLGVAPKGAEPPPAAPRGIPISAQRWVLAGLLGAVLLNVGHVAPWCLPLASGAAAWRIWAAQQPTRLLGRWPRIAVVVVLTLAVLISFRTLNGLDAGASLLVAMAALKLMETQRVRDWLIVLGAALFLLLAACLGAQSLWLVPLYAAELWLLSTALYALGAGESAPGATPLLCAAGRSLLLALPLAVLLFLFFPRLPGSLWTVPKEDEAVTGLGDQLDPGSIAKLVESDEPALRVRFSGSIPRREERYWRGPVLHRFDGTTWRRAQRDLGEPPAIEYAGPGYRYEVTLEPGTHGVLVGLDLPRGLPPDLYTAFRSFDEQLTDSKPSDNVISYHLESFPRHRNLDALPAAMRALDLTLPRARNPRSIELAQQLRAGARDDHTYVQAVLDYLQNNGFEYTLTPPKLGANSIDDLLFDTRQGFCGHYASAFAMLMRAGGVPAHVVTGYLGGEWNRFGEYLLVRQSNAHAWTEVWLEGTGWVRVDPTAVVAPDRLHSDFDDAVTAGSASGRRTHAAPWIASTVQAWQAMNAWWQDEFINFNMDRQLDLLGSLGFKDRDYEVLVGILAAGGTLWLSLLAWRGRQSAGSGSRDALSRSWHRLERALRRAAPARAAHEGPVAYGERVAAEHPELAATLKPLTREYAQLRYGPPAGAAALQRFERAVRLFAARITR